MSRRLAVAAGALALLSALVPAVASRAGSGSAVASVSGPAAVVAAAPRSAAGALYRFTTVLSGKPIRWNPCLPIHWQFRAAGAPAGGRAVVTQAVARIAQATGTRWVFDGVVASAPTSAWLPQTSDAHRPVLIGWTDSAHSDLLRGQPGGVLGVTRTAWFGLSTGTVTIASIQGAVIALNRAARLPATGPASWRTATLHELGHAMGLDHAGSSAELMYPVLQRSLTDLQAGDLRGLAKVGRPAGCISA